MRKKLERLASLVEGAKIIGNPNTFVTDIVQNSGQTSRGAMFVCVSGERTDGHKYIPEARKNGAAAILTDRDVTLPEGMAAIRVSNLEEALEKIVPYFFDIPSQRLRVIGITGTNGKTTTSFLIRSVLRRAGRKVGLIGTIQTMIEEKVLPSQNMNFL